MDVVIAAEDTLGERLLQKMIGHANGLSVYQSIPMGGIGVVKSKITAFQNASKHLPQVVLVDLDRKNCAPELIAEWKIRLEYFPWLLFRVAIRESESWVLADREGVADFLQVSLKKVPEYPEALDNPKQELVNLARKSRSRRLREEMVPAPGSSAQVGPLYNSHVSNFVSDNWNLQAACLASPSLEKAFRRIRELGHQFLAR